MKLEMKVNKRGLERVIHFLHSDENKIRGDSELTGSIIYHYILSLENASLQGNESFYDLVIENARFYDDEDAAPYITNLLSEAYQSGESKKFQLKLNNGEKE